MQNQVKKKLPNSTIILYSVDGQNGELCYEESSSGSFVMNELQKVLNSAEDMTIKQALAQVDANVNKTARRHNVKQDPACLCMGDPRAGDLMIQETLKSLDRVLFMVPVYYGQVRKFPRLPGALRDLSEFVSSKKKPFGPDCHITIVGVPSGGCYAKGVHSFEDPKDAKSQLAQIMDFDGNVAVFVCGHGAKGMKEGDLDEYLVMPGQAEEDRIYGLDVARMIVKRNKEKLGLLLFFPDLCYGNGFPGPNDFEKAVNELVPIRSVVAARGGRGVSRTELVQQLVDNEVERTVSKFALLQLANVNIGPMARAVSAQCSAEIYPFEEQAMRHLYPGGEHEDMCGWTRGSLPEDSHTFGVLSEGDGDFEQAESLAQLPAGASRTRTQAVAPIQQSPAPTVEAARVLTTAAAIPVGNDEVQARGVPEDIVSLWHELPGLLQRAWEGLEALYGCLFGAGMLSFVLPWVIGALLVVFGAALWLYMRFMARQGASTLFPMLVVFLVTTFLPYLCDPIVLQNFFTAGNSVCVGLVCTAACFVVLLLSVAADWGRLSTKASALFKATNLAGKYSLLARLALEMHFMGGGRAVQQTVHIQSGGVSAFVMYYPLMANATHRVCPVRMSNNKYKFLPVETNFTILDKALDHGALADLTCDYNRFLERVNQRAKVLSDITHLYVNDGQYAIDLRDLHIDAKHVERLLRANTTGPVHTAALVQELDPKWTQNGKHFHIQLPSLQKKSQLTPVEWVAAPFFFAVEKLVGLSLWPVLPRALPSREL
jgi:hypothetical protein